MINASVIVNNTALAGTGGVALASEVGAVLSVYDSVAANNSAANGAGAVLFDTNFDSLTLRNVSFLGNSGPQCGAVMVVNANKALLENSTFVGNSATAGDGGAVCLVRQAASMQTCVNGVQLQGTLLAGVIGVMLPEQLLPLEDITCAWELTPLPQCTMELSITSIGLFPPYTVTLSVTDLDTASRRTPRPRRSQPDAARSPACVQRLQQAPALAAARCVQTCMRRAPACTGEAGVIPILKEEILNAEPTGRVQGAVLFSSDCTNVSLPAPIRSSGSAGLLVSYISLNSINRMLVYGGLAASWRSVCHVNRTSSAVGAPSLARSAGRCAALSHAAPLCAALRYRTLRGCRLACRALLPHGFLLRRGLIPRFVRVFHPSLQLLGTRCWHFAA